MVACARIAAGGWRPRRRWRLKGPGRTFSIVDPAGTWAWRSRPVDAAAVRQGAVLALLAVAAAVVELPRRAEAAVQRRAEAALPELPRRAEAAIAPRWLEACSQEALKRCRTADCRRCYPWRYRCRWLFRHAVAHREAHDCPAESQCCRCRFSYQRRRYPRCPVTARQEACDCREASQC